MNKGINLSDITSPDGGIDGAIFGSETGKLFYVTKEFMADAVAFEKYIVSDKLKLHKFPAGSPAPLVFHDETTGKQIQEVRAERMVFIGRFTLRCAFVKEINTWFVIGDAVYYPPVESLTAKVEGTFDTKTTALDILLG